MLVTNKHKKVYIGNKIASSLNKYVLSTISKKTFEVFSTTDNAIAKTDNTIADFRETINNNNFKA